MSEDEFSEFRFGSQLDLIDTFFLGSHLTYLKMEPYEDNGFRKFYTRIEKIYTLLENSDFDSFVENEIVDLVNAWTDEEGKLEVEEYDSDELSKFANRWAQQLQEELRTETRIPVNQDGFLM
ncbi:MAG: hypothetical protein ABEK16_04995 [Candidatus Nanohalobium sp.]